MEFIFKLGPVFIAVEIIVVVVMNLATKNTTKLLSAWTILLLLTIGIYITLKVGKYYYDKLFPKSLVEAIEKDLEAESLTQGSARKSMINRAIATSMISLNDQTCKLIDRNTNYVIDGVSANGNRLCDQDVHNGLKDLLSPLLDILPYVLEATDARFTIGVYLEDICTEEDRSAVYHNKTYLLKDDLEASAIATSTIMGEESLRGEQLELQAILTAANNNNDFTIKPMRINGMGCTVVACPIPVVCNIEESDGVLFILHRKLSNAPVDLEEVLEIFNRTLANWKSQYNECVQNHFLYDTEKLTFQLDDKSTIKLYEGGGWKHFAPPPAEAKKIKSK